MPDLSFWGELIGFGLAIGCSPLHVALLLLLLLGPDPLRRGGWLVAAWLLTSLVELLLLLSLGHGLVLSMERGTSHRTGLDLLAAGGLLALGLNELLHRPPEATPPDWTQRLDGFCRLSLPPLLALSTLFEVATPDDLFLYTKASGNLLASGLDRPHEVLAGLVFSLSTSVLLLLPLLGVVLLGQERALPLLQRIKDWIYRRGDWIVGVLSLLLAGYFGWQGIGGLVAG